MSDLCGHRLGLGRGGGLGLGSGAGLGDAGDEALGQLGGTLQTAAGVGADVLEGGMYAVATHLKRLPPRETGTELRRTTGRPPPLHRQSNALEIDRSDPTLELLPTNADQEMPTPSGPTDLKMLSHTFLLREHFQGGRAAGSTGRAGEPTTPDSPKES